jgi:hypothetical protein
MLIDILNKNEINLIAEKYINVLKDMSTVINENSVVRPKNKHHFIRPLRSNGFSQTDINQLGMKCGDKLWRSCLQRKPRHLGGRPSLGKDAIKEMNLHMESISSIAPNRIVSRPLYLKRDPVVFNKKIKVGRTISGLCYRHTTFVEAFRQFKQKQNSSLEQRNIINNLKFCSFYKSLRKNYKKPFRKSDLCQYCEFGKDTIKEIEKFIKLRNLGFKKEFNSYNLNSLRS